MYSLVKYYKAHTEPCKYHTAQLCSHACNVCYTSSYINVFGGRMVVVVWDGERLYHSRVFTLLFPFGIVPFPFKFLSKFC